MGRNREVVYRSWRGDLFVHRATRQMRPLSYCIMYAAVAENLLGILKESTRVISRRFRDTSPADVECAIDELASRGNAVWWEEDEILWICSALEEQANNKSCYASAARHALTLPEHIRTAIYKRYTVLHRVSDTVSHTLFAQEQDQEKEKDQYQDQENLGLEIQLGDPPNPARDAARRVLDALNEARSEFVPGSRLRLTDEIEARIREGRTEDECLLVIAGEVASCRHDRTKNLPWFDTVTPFRPQNFERRLARAQALPQSRGPIDMGDIE